MVAACLMGCSDSCCEIFAAWPVALKRSSQHAPSGLPCWSTQVTKWQATSYLWLYPAPQIGHRCLARGSVLDEVPEGFGDPVLGGSREGITTPFVTASLAWYWATASPVDCFSRRSVWGDDISALLLSVGDDV